MLDHVLASTTFVERWLYPWTTLASTIIVDIGAILSYGTIMLAPKQSRAARGWLDWSQEQLAERANVALSTVRDFEKGRRTPISNNLTAMRAALEGAGVMPVHNDAGQPVGVTRTACQSLKSGSSS